MCPQKDELFCALPGVVLTLNVLLASENRHSFQTFVTVFHKLITIGISNAFSNRNLLGCAMRLARFCVVTLFLCGFGALMAHANPVDPRIGVGEPSCSETDTVVSSNTFTVSTDQTGQGQFFFCNESGNNWQNMYFFAQTNVSPADVVCTPGAFVFCQAFTTNLAPGYLYIEFAGVVTGPAPPICPNGCPGVPNNEEFFVDFNCGDFSGCVGWTPAPLTFTVVANSNGIPLPVPEPTSMALLATGLTGGALKLVRRRRNSKRQMTS